MPDSSSPNPNEFIDRVKRIRPLFVPEKSRRPAIVDGAELWVVMQDRLRRAFSFKDGATVIVYGSTVRFDKVDVIEELVVDEEKQLGKRK